MNYAADFEQFWQRYPRKVGKLAARKAFERARRLNGATQAAVLAGIDAYVVHKPAYADFAHPATWLNQGRWMDEWVAPVKSQRTYWADECQELHGGTCAKQWDHEMRKRQAQAS